MEAVKITVSQQAILTYPEPPCENFPIYAENRVHQRTSGRPYPNKVVLNVERSKSEMREYTVVTLENEYIIVDILPEIGGRIFGARDKRTGYDFFYRQHVIKPALIGVLGSWISGGVEFNWPFHHRASGFMPCDFTTETLSDGSAACHLSEHDPIDRMKGMVTVVLRPGAVYLETQMRLYNRTETKKSFLWWENAAVPVNENYRIFFPKDVGYVNFHYLKSRTTFPIASPCTYNGIKIDLPTDISKHKNTHAATSYFSAASKYDFFGGYDEGKEAGVVHIADHHIAPGKKMFTWGYGQLSRSWERALTDTDGAYAELMAGTYSDNQPNFSWLAPYETKCFSQYWYPIEKIGAPDFANLHGALRIDRAERKLFLTLTDRTGEAKIEVLCGQHEILSEKRQTSPAACEVFALPELAEGERLSVRVTMAGAVLLSYAEEPAGNVTVPDTIPDTPRPEELKTAQDLTLAGVHVDQYRDPAVYPDAYFKAALEKQSDYIPALLGMAKFSYRYADYPAALDFITRAERAQNLLNTRAESGEIYYVKGLILEAMGEKGAALDAYHAAAWDGDTVLRAMTRIASLDLADGEYVTALDHAERALAHGCENNLALAERAVALTLLGRTEEAEKINRERKVKDPFAYTLRLAVERDLPAVFRGMSSDPVQTILDSAFEFEAMGQGERAAQILASLDACLSDKSPAILAVARAHFAKTQEEKRALLLRAESMPVGKTYPSRKEEYALLKALAPESKIASYLFGCIAYALHRYGEAQEAWERVNTPDFPHRAVVSRNLALVAFNHKGQKDEALARMKTAYETAKSADRAGMLFELLTLLDMTGADPHENLALLEKELPLQRDDLVLERAKAYNRLGNPDAALEVLLSHPFTSCEGGEHAIADQYMFAQFLLAERARKGGAYEKALARYRAAQILPESLGAGLWNEVKKVPYLYGEANALTALGDASAAKEIYRRIASWKVDYFTNMHLKELPVFKALAHRALGEEAEASALLTAARESFVKAKAASDPGYFGTTPFFLPFVKPAKELRTAQFGYLLALADFAEGKGTAEAFADAYRKNSELLFAGFFAKAIAP